MTQHKNHKVVYEHQKVTLADEVFNEKELKTLWALNDANGGNYFTNLHNGIRFSQYVGVIQVGKKTIEVLPKTDNNASDDPALWQNVLVKMLQVARNLPVKSLSDANLKHRPSRLLELYFSQYIAEVEGIARRGLTKAYRTEEGNVTALKGSLQFGKHLQQNLVHKERFYTRHQVYDTKHMLHSILRKGLEVIQRFPSGQILSDRIAKLAMQLPEGYTHIDAETFGKLHLSRKTEHYSKAIDIARLLILNYSPDISSGREQMLAIMFDMNKLWEDYVLRILKRNAPEGWTVEGQESEVFWQENTTDAVKNVRPDIVLRKDNKEGSEKSEIYVLDTKWKVPSDNKPSDADLKQMYVYNLLWGTNKSTLLYPQPGDQKLRDVTGSYNEGPILKEHHHGCDMLFLDIIDRESKGLKPEAVKELFKLLSPQVAVPEDIEEKGVEID